MNEKEFLAQRFEAERARLRGVAYRMLGSSTEADDALQEAWLNVSRAGAEGVQNLSGWLTTVVARVCLDMLRSRKSRREAPAEEAPQLAAGDPENEAVLADSVGLALLVVLDTLAPAERVAFVLHDLFGVSFDEIAAIVGRTPEAARQLASRARRRVRGAEPDADRSREREVVEAFIVALRAGDFQALLAVLDPDVVVRGDGPEPLVIRGAENWAKGAVVFAKVAREIQAALLDGTLGVIYAPRGKMARALRFTIEDGKIVEAEIISEPERVARLEVSVLD